MVGRGQDKSKLLRLRAPPSAESLSYWIELWESKGNSVERVLARAFNAELARVIFKAARTEHPDRRITLRRGAKVLSDTAG
jgi:hypothetical protein